MQTVTNYLEYIWSNEFPLVVHIVNRDIRVEEYISFASRVSPDIQCVVIRIGVWFSCFNFLVNLIYIVSQISQNLLRTFHVRFQHWTLAVVSVDVWPPFLRVYLECIIFSQWLFYILGTSKDWVILCGGDETMFLTIAETLLFGTEKTWWHYFVVRDDSNEIFDLLIIRIEISH